MEVGIDFSDFIDGAVLNSTAESVSAAQLSNLWYAFVR